MRGPLAYALVAAGLLCAAPGAGRPVEASELQAVVDSLGNFRSAADAERSLKRLNAFRKRGGSPALMTRVDSLRGIVLTMLRRFPDADAAFTAAALGQPTESFPLESQFDISESIGNLGGARHALDRLIDAFPDVARGLSGQKLYPVIRGVRDADWDAADTLTVRLAGIGWGEDLISSRDAMALSAVKIELKRKNGDAAAQLSRKIIDRASLVGLLTYRVFEPLWPSIEVRVGDRMEQPTREVVLNAEQRVKERPESIPARHELLIAYRHAGRLTDAERVGSGFATTDAEIDGLTEEGGWLVNDHAILLLRLDRKADSNARFASLRRIPIAQAPWLISMIINRAEFLTRTDQNAAAWALIGEAEEHSRTYGSLYARQLVRRMKACVAYREKRPDAQALVQAFVDNAKDAPGATIEGLMCVDRVDQAARDAIALLGDEKKREGMIDSLLPDEDIRADPSGWGASRLLERVEVRTAFDKVARVLPSRFVVPKGGVSP